MSKLILTGLTLPELETFVASIDEPKFRAKQLFMWLYAKRARTFDEMSDLGKPLRTRLSEVAEIGKMELAGTQRSPSDGTTKYLFKLADGNHVEAVLIPSESRNDDGDPKRRTVCISTQVGCALDCKFCATASMKVKRDLTPFEIIAQFLEVERSAKARLTNIVYMGMGEPMLNYDSVMKSVEIFTHAAAELVGANHITISTAGIVDGIRRMGDENRKVKLAISLHTLDNHLRTALMPINKKYPVPLLLDAVDHYYEKTKRTVTFEYILFDELNDTDADIKRIIVLSRRIPCKFNFIPFHPSEAITPSGIGARLRPTPRGRVDAIVKALREAHVTVMVRSSAGEDISGACGQLAVKATKEKVVW